MLLLAVGPLATAASADTRSTSALMSLSLRLRPPMGCFVSSPVDRVPDAKRVPVVPGKLVNLVAK